MPDAEVERLMERDLLAPAIGVDPSHTAKRAPSKISGSVDSETIESTIPGQGHDTREVTGGVSVEPRGKQGPKVSIETGMKERARAGEPDAEPDRQATGGVRIEIPLPD